MIIQKYFETRSKVVEEELNRYLTTTEQEPKQLYEAIRYSVFGNAKRLRPILLLAVYEMLNQTDKISLIAPALPAACAIEMVHAASLIHDDLPSVDDSDERRGMQSCHKKFDSATAILAGDALLTKAFEVLSYIEDPAKASKCVNILCNAISTRGMIGGQTVDVLSSEKNVQLNVIQYVHLKKTGALLQAATDLACTVYGTDANLTSTLSTYASNLGLAYQIIDDILDEIGEFEMLGKEPYEDVRNSKSTYSSIMGLDKARKSALKYLDDSFKLIKNMPHNEVLVEFVSMIKERLP